MMKRLAVIIVLFIISCKNNSRQQAHVLPKPASDSFIDIDAEPDQASLSSYGILLDTLVRHNQDSTYYEELVLPKLINKENALLELNLRKEIIALRNSFLGREDDPDSSDIRMTPITIYKDSNFISYSFDLMLSGEGMTRPYMRSETLNYDIRLNKAVRFSDYFNISASADTNYFKKMLLSSLHGILFGSIIEKEKMTELQLDDGIDFSFDNESIYFFFRRGELTQSDISGGIKRKYLEQFIKDRYK